MKRDPADQRHATVSWTASARSEFYIVRFGVLGKETFHSVQVYPEPQQQGTVEAEINSLVDGVTYEFVVDAVNAVGVTMSENPTIA